MVPFLHITSKIEGAKYDGLLQEKGFGGFPTLAFMDADGEVIHQQGGRSVEAFEKSLGALARLDELKAKAADGDQEAAWELLVAKWDLGMLKHADLMKAQDSMKELTDKRKAKLAWMMVEAEVQELAATTRVRDPEKLDAALAKAKDRFLEILKSGHEFGENTESTVWGTLMTWAERNKDSELYAKAVAFFEKHYKDEPRAERWLQGLRDKLAEMQKEGATP